MSYLLLVLCVRVLLALGAVVFAARAWTQRCAEGDEVIVDCSIAAGCVALAVMA